MNDCLEYPVSGCVNYTVKFFYCPAEASPPTKMDYPSEDKFVHVDHGRQDIWFSERVKHSVSVYLNTDDNESYLFYHHPETFDYAMFVTLLAEHGIYK